MNHIKQSKLFSRYVGLTILTFLIVTQSLTIYKRWDGWPLTYYPMFAEPLDLKKLYGFRIVGSRDDHSEVIIKLIHGKASWATLDNIYKSHNILEFKNFLHQNNSDNSLSQYRKIILYKVSLDQNQANFIWARALEVTL